MNLYIKIENGSPINHPVLEDNLKELWEVMEITDTLLFEKGFVKFENKEAGLGEELLISDGYEICQDGIARNKSTVRALTQKEKVNLWVRRHRDYVLMQSDWTQMADSPLSFEKKAEWAAYRQELRDMAAKYANIQDPSEIAPPVEPSR